MTYYDVLEISKSASLEVIKAAYRSLSQKHHPDKNNSHDDAHKKMSEINIAYNTLIDEGRRAAYDKLLRQDDASHHYEKQKTDADSNKESNGISGEKIILSAIFGVLTGIWLG